jgi:hypothetical protein
LIAHAGSELSGWVSGLVMMVGTWTGALRKNLKLKERHKKQLCTPRYKLITRLFTNYIPLQEQILVIKRMTLQ